MVTKHHHIQALSYQGLILAKNHMVTKHGIDKFDLAIGLILAKNHMVTKRSEYRL